VLILLLSLAVNGLFAWKHIDASKKGVSYTEKVINGTTYQVLIYNVEVKEGQKKIFIYGFTVVNEDGKLTNVAVLFGEFDINE
jgi:hypothetical protein